MAESVVYLGNIYVLETSRAYRREVLRYLDLMSSTRSGMTLMKHINKTGRWLLIEPFRPDKTDPVNAYAWAKDEKDSRPENYTYMHEMELPNKRKIKYVAGVGTGRGSETYVDYHPATWRQREKNMGGIGVGAGPAEILFHEMTHAYRMQRGLSVDDPVPNYPQFDDVEEFYAILAANVYRSERGFTHLRTDHWGFKKQGAYLSYPAFFYDEFRDLINKWFADDRAFCLAMADVDAKFNPFQYAAVDLGLRTYLPYAMRLPA